MIDNPLVFKSKSLNQIWRMSDVCLTCVFLPQELVWFQAYLVVFLMENALIRKAFGESHVQCRRRSFPP